MDKNLIKFLDNINLPLGTTIVIIIGLITFCSGLYIGIKKARKKYENTVRRKIKSAEENKEFHESVQTIASTVSTIQDSMNSFANSHKDINEALTNLKSVVDSIQKKSAETDEVLGNRIDTINNKLSAMDEKSSLLIESDREGIKSYITDKYYQALSDRYIELHVLETLELRYKMYLQENGNTYVRKLMESMREMPNRKPDDE